MTPPDLAIQEGRLMITAHGGRLCLVARRARDCRDHSYEKKICLTRIAREKEREMLFRICFDCSLTLHNCFSSE